MLNTPNFMDILGISGHYRGFRYLLYCVNQTAKDNDLLDPMNRKLYPLAAKRFGVTPKYLSGSIRNFIKAWWLYGDHTAITPILKSDSTPPGNKELIYALVVYLQRKDK